jgi:hypothetical protein
MNGMTATSLPNADNRILLFGGSFEFHPGELMGGRIPTPSEASFEVRYAFIHMI